MTSTHDTPELRRPAPAAAGFAAALLLAGAAPAALAQTSSASVSFTSLTIVTSVGTLSFLPGSAYQTLNAEALDAGGFAGFDSKSSEAPNYLPASVTAATAAASGTATSRANQTVAASASAKVTTGPLFSLQSQGSASATTSGEFTLSQPGTVTFFAAYTSNVAGAALNTTDRYGLALAEFTLGSNTDPNKGGRLDDRVYSSDFVGGSGTRNGTLTLSVTLAAGEVGYYNLLASSSALAPVTAVPEPATWASMLAGMGVLAAAGTRRRRTRAAG